MGHRPRVWNHWWTITVVSATLTAMVMLLEYLGIFRDLGLFLSGLGIVATGVFSVAAATRASVDTVSVSIERVELRLDKLDKLDKLDRIETQLVALDRIEALLRERLPTRT